LHPAERAASPVDLHTHTNASDGLLTPAELVDLASRRGLSVLGITDHDTIDGLAEATRRAAERNVTLVPGVELSTTGTGAELHILGYFVDTTDAVFVGRLRELAEGRRERIGRMVALLNEQGYPVALDRVFALAGDGSVGRPHIARALMELGVVASVGEAFDRFLGRNGPAWVPRAPFPPEEALALLSANGALPVIAHPYTTRGPQEMIDRLLPRGLRGLECFYGEYDVAQHQALLRMATAAGLVPTGGSDYHGPKFKEGRELGSAPVPMSSYEALRSLHELVQRGR
jgi:predicted metal-dependent phosphoesterase TrpH